MPAEEIDLAREADFALGAALVRPSIRALATNGSETIVEPRVMQVLVALGRRAGEVVSRDELVARCWGGRIVGEDAIQRPIALLRRLEKQTGAFAIETIAKVGYRLSTAGSASRAEAATPQPVLAVLPFANLSPDPEQDYFADGLSEELMNQLGQVRGMQVVGRTSAFAFKGRNEDLRTIGQTLGVTHILEGSVRKAGKRLRISAQLVDCADGRRHSSQTFDRDLDDVFAIQEEIAEAVARALSVTLGVGSDAPDYGGTRSFEAYDQFLRGRFLPGMVYPQPEFRRRLDHLRKAVTADPGFANAWANLANLIAFVQPGLTPEAAEALDAERDAAAEKALALAPDLPVALIADGWRRADGHAWEAAEASFRRALRRGLGNDPQAEGVVGAYFTDVGWVREGLPLRERARDSDPLSLGWSGHLLGSYHTLELGDDFDAEYRRTADLPGDRSSVERARLLHLMAAGAPEVDVAKQLERLLASGWPAAAALARVAAVYPSADRAGAILRDQLGRAPAELFLVAQLAGICGDDELAIEALRIGAPHARLVLLQQLWRPELRGARRLPGFREIVEGLGLARLWRATGKWPDVCRPDGRGGYDFVA